MIDKLKRILNTGKINLGSKQTINDLVNGIAKAVVVSNNCPKDIKEDIRDYGKKSNTPVVEFEGTSFELGEFCGKPYLVAALSINDSGEVTVKEFVKEAQK